MRLPKATPIWNPPAVDRRTFELSPQRPLQSHVNLHTGKQNAAFDMHWELELGVVCSGAMRRDYENWSCVMKPGDVWFCGMWEPHGWQVTATPCECVVLVILPQMLVNLRCDEAPGLNWLSPFTVPPRERPRTDSSGRVAMRGMARRFAEIQNAPETQRALWQRLLLMEILLSLFKNWQPAANRANGAAGDTHYQRVNRAIQMVFSRKALVTAGEAAAACGVGRNRFNALFEELMGITFAKFALRYRLSNAAMDLLHGDSPTKTIAADWGFTDASHLHHCFQRHYGCSPLEYRTRGKK